MKTFKYNQNTKVIVAETFRAYIQYGDGPEVVVPGFHETATAAYDAAVNYILETT